MLFQRNNSHFKDEKIYNPSFLARSQFTVYALGRKTFIELAIIVLVDGGMHMKISRVSQRMETYRSEFLVLFEMITEYV